MRTENYFHVPGTDKYIHMSECLGGMVDRQSGRTKGTKFLYEDFAVLFLVLFSFFSSLPTRKNLKGVYEPRGSWEGGHTLVQKVVFPNDVPCNASQSLSVFGLIHTNGGHWDAWRLLTGSTPMDYGLDLWLLARGKEICSILVRRLERHAMGRKYGE